MFFKTNTIKILQIIAFAAILLGIFFRFYNLNWGSAYYFHPDERNIASSVSQLSFPDQMDPHFFAYGSLPIYSIYFTGILTNYTNQFTTSQENVNKVSFETAILIGRFFSAIFSVVILLLLYQIGKIAFGNAAGLTSAILGSLSIGFIQYSHFATFEMWLTFFTLLLCYEAINYVKKPRLIHLFFIHLLIGILISIKISSLVFIIIPIVLVLGKRISILKRRNLSPKKLLLKISLTLFLFIVTTFTVLITSPYFIINYEEFRNSIRYESSVGLGTLPVFYTQGFIDTLPIIYQFIKVYPFILNPLVLVIFLLTLPLAIKGIVRQRNEAGLIILLFFLITFLSQAFLYVKWIRYYIPSLPFIYLITASILLPRITHITKIPKVFFASLLILSLAASFLFSYSFVKTVYINPDTRTHAAEWAAKNIPNSTQIISEVYDMGIVPFNPYFSQISLINFYDIETVPQQEQEFQSKLAQAEYIILPSQRILQTRLHAPHLYPKGSVFYNHLLDSSKYQMLYSSQCDFFCNILYLGDPALFYEQTAYVFDRPQVFIFKKIPQ